VFEDLHMRRTLWGVVIEESSGVRLTQLDVRDIGQEGIRVARQSSWVTIENTVINGTGNRTGIAPDGQPYATFGEGIYLGTGSTEADAVHHVTIVGNDISNTGTEAIDVKAPVANVTIRGNRIHDINTFTSGAIVVHLTNDHSSTNPGILIAGNEIFNITTRTSWQDGNAIVLGSAADIRNNTFRNLQHYGIRVEDGGSQGANITARISANTFSQVGNSAVWSVAGNATVELSGNSGIS
jgi:hypothetical protein